jgi:hypothetical protein
MEIIASSKQIFISKVKSDHLRLFNNHFIMPLRSGFKGFIIILMIIFFIRLLFYATGISNNLSFDIIDLLLSLTGFILLFFERLIKSYNP